MSEPDPSKKFSELRKRAEESLDDQLSPIAYFSPEDTVKTIHDLRVHQIELELQNEELHATQQELESSRLKYADLYEFSPVGLLTLDSQKNIQEANLTFAKLMSMSREKIIHHNLTDFIDSSSQETFHHFFQSLRRTQELQNCEIILRPINHPPIPVKLEGIHFQAATYRIAVSDITEQHQAEIERARLYAAEQAALAQADELTLRLAILQQITAALSESVTPQEVINVMLSRIPSALQASSVSLALLKADEHTFEHEYFSDSPHDALQPVQPVSLPLSEAVRTQKVIWLPHLQTDQTQYPELQSTFQPPTGIQAMVSIPLSVKEHKLGGMALYFTHPHRRSDEEKNFILAVVGQGALALERAQLAQQIAATQERQWLAQELHDSVTQSIYSVSILAQTLPALWESKPDEARQQAQLIRTLTQGALAEMRTLLVELHPEAIVRTPIQDLLKQLSAATQSRMEIGLVLDIQDVPVTLPEEVHIAIYRIAQESINNVIKHSHATRLRISLHFQPKQITLEIADNGDGFNMTEHTTGFGHITTQERANTIGANLTIDSKLGKGTRIKLVWKSPIPLKHSFNSSVK